MKLTATQLRGDLYQVLDRILESGEPVEVDRAGGTVALTVAKPARATKVRRRKPGKNPQLVVGNADDLVHFDWAKHWKPFL